MIQKPFPCDVDENLMKCTDDDRVNMVHRKRHDMVLNIGLGPKVNTFSDQTPTPTTFIKNCEEVGLFQDLQNVNPFEETFKKAVEAVKAGQTPSLDKSFQTDPPDDTLHTPNIFPHITGLHGTNQGDGIAAQENGHPVESRIDNEGKIVKEVKKNLPLKKNVGAKKLNLRKVAHKKRKNEDNETTVVGLESVCSTTENTNADISQNNVLPTDSINELNPVQTALKEKIRNNTNNKTEKLPVLMTLKIPIPKAKPPLKYVRYDKNQFSTFSKNSLKFQSQMENSQLEGSDSNDPKMTQNDSKRLQKNSSDISKEKLDILERNRAAATRCREKKKIYVSYLEKINRELTEANKTLQMENHNLRRKVTILHKELVKLQESIGFRSNGNLEASLINNNNNSIENGQNIDNNVNGNLNTTDVSVGTGLENEVSGEGQNTMETSVHDANASHQTTDHQEPVVFENVEVLGSDNVVDDKKTLYFNYNDPLGNPEQINFEKQKLEKLYTDHAYFNYPVAISAENSNIHPETKAKLTSLMLTAGIQSEYRPKKSDDDDNAGIVYNPNPYVMAVPQQNPTFFNPVAPEMMVNIMPSPIVIWQPPSYCSWQTVLPNEI